MCKVISRCGLNILKEKVIVRKLNCININRNKGTLKW